jgi:SSS family solute:Na+ symporter
VRQVEGANYSWDFVHASFWVLVFNGIFYALQKYGTDQTIVQRYLTAKSDHAAKRAAYIGVFTSLPIWTLFMIIGIALYTFYQTGVQPPLPEGIKADEVFPFFISTQLPVGIKGLIIAALSAGAISSLDSDINCLAAIGVQDYYLKIKPDASDRRQLFVGRLLVFIVGIACIGVSMLYALWDGEGVLGVVFQLYAIFSAGIVGILLLGLFSKRANRQGLYWGIGAAVLFTAYALLTSTPIGVGEEKHILLDLGSLNYTHHKLMLGVYSHVVLFVVAYIASLAYYKKDAADDLTVYGFLKMRKETKGN